jgi:type 2 lantibiotic biosynthesis protein LanM
MKLTRVHMPMTGQKNLPKIGDKNIKPDDYVTAIQDSFRKSYLYIKENHLDFTKDNGILDLFKQDAIRLLFRPTMAYAQILETSFHPDYLHNQIDRDLWFEKLHYTVGDRKITGEMIAAEQSAFYKGDVPIYVSTPGSRHLLTDEGELKNFFNIPGLDEVKEKIHTLSQEDCDKQCWYIGAAVATSIPADTSGPLQFEKLVEATEVSDKKELESAAQMVAQRLETLAVRRADTANWIGMFLNHNNYYDIRPLNIDMYSGLTGIILFYGYWQFATGDNRYQKLLDESLKSLSAYSDSLIEAKKENLNGAFSGLGGIAYTFFHLGTILDRSDLIDKSIETLHYLADTFVPKDNKEVDIIGGSAGLILVLNGVLTHRSDPKLLDFARQLGQHLVDTAIPTETGKGWKIVSKEPLAGFGHGAAGIAYALFQLYHLTGDTQFLEVAQAAIEYEKSLYLPEKKNWMDMRDLSVEAGNQRLEKANMVAWCNGATGIGFSRLGILAKQDAPGMREELNVAVETTLKDSLGKNHSLCHGDLGNLDFLYEAALFTKDTNLQNRVYRFLKSVVKNIRTDGFLCGVPLKVENPGLMTGIAGIGYQLLRFAYPDRVPSVLMLEGPKGN